MCPIARGQCTATLAAGERLANRKRQRPESRGVGDCTRLRSLTLPFRQDKNAGSAYDRTRAAVGLAASAGFDASVVAGWFATVSWMKRNFSTAGADTTKG